VRDDVLGHLLQASSGAEECEDVARWWPGYLRLERTWRNPMDRAMVAGSSADRAAWAFAGGYQCALQALFPGLPEDALAALCVSEDEGNHPRAIRTALHRAAAGWRLEGAKRWTTLGPQGALFLVLAREAQTDGERAAALLLALRALAAEDAARPQTHLALAGILDAAAAVIADAESSWNRSPADAARARRTEAAWRRLGEASTRARGNWS
jgi:hypothetical protein